MINFALPRRSLQSESDLMQQFAASSSSENDTMHSSLMNDFDSYPEIDDIELPDGSQIGFGDTNLDIHDQKQLLRDSEEEFNLIAATALKNFGYLSDSAQSVDDGTKQYICRHCGKRYRWKSTLRRHESVECGGKEPCHKCPHCPYRAKQRGNLGVHIRKHHTDMPPLESRRKANRTM